MRFARCRRLAGVLVALMGVWPAVTQAQALTGWLWSSGHDDYAYSVDETNWLYVVPAGPAAYCNLSNGQWGADASGWVWVTLDPYLYSAASGTWLYAVKSTAGLEWVYHFSTHQWTRTPDVADLAPLASAGFPLQYECDTLPTSAGFSENGSGLAAATSNGWLTLTASAYGTYVNNSSWVGDDTAYTVEMRSKVPREGTLSVQMDDGVNWDTLKVFSNGVYLLSYQTGIASLVPDSVHTFRYAFWKSGGVRYGQLWIDGASVQGPAAHAGGTTFPGMFRFGQAGSGSLAVDMDYLRMTKAGAYAPN